MTETAARVMRFAEEQRWRARIVPIEHLPDVKQAIVGRHEDALFDETFYQERLTWFSFEPPEELPAARSMIVLSVPVPTFRTLFRWKGKDVAGIMPPTYVAYGSTTRRIQASVESFLAEEGYGAAPTRLPLKTLAVSSGLADYGRNNITYVSGMGSFHQLVGCYSDLPPADDPWREPQRLARCEKCTACLRQCPTGAIGEDRFLLHAERCLVYHNERAGDFPAWIDTAWHNSLMGCMLCQQTCPEDKAFVGWVEDKCGFSEEETALLLAGTPADRLPLDTLAKLQGLDLIEDLPNLARNLGVLLDKA